MQISYIMTSTLERTIFYLYFSTMTICILFTIFIVLSFLYFIFGFLIIFKNMNVECQHNFWEINLMMIVTNLINFILIFVLNKKNLIYITYLILLIFFYSVYVGISLSQIFINPNNCIKNNDNFTKISKLQFSLNLLILFILIITSIYKIYNSYNSFRNSNNNRDIEI